MNRLTIVMNNDRSLVQDTYSLGVERDNKIDELALITPKTWGGLDIFSSVVSLHLKAENDYYYNAVCDNKHIDGDFAVFLFPVTREMTNRSGKVKVEFAFENSAFCFTSRSVDLTVNKALTDSENVESDYPGVLVDVLNTVENFAKRLDDADLLIETIDDDVDVLFNKAGRMDSSIGKIEALLGYDDEEILGLEADFENNAFTRLAGARNLEAGEDFDRFPMYQRRRCNVNDDGTIVAYYGDENYRDDGSNGQVMVYQPAFYYRVVPTKLEKIEGGLGYHIRKANYYISANPKPFFKLHPAFYDENGKAVEYILYGAYEGSIADNKLCSVAGVKPTANHMRLNFESFAKARGNGWHIETIKAVAVNQLLMAIEFASFNSQESIGKGVVSIKDDGTSNCASFTGSTAFLGNSSGSAVSTVNEKGGVETTYTENGYVSVSYRGVENLWGNIYTHISDVNIWGDGTMLGGQPYIADDFSFNIDKHDENYSPAGFVMTNGSNKYISAFGYGGEGFDWLFGPSETAGMSVLPVGDYRIGSADVQMGYGIAIGGRHDTSNGGGLFTWRVCNRVGESRDISARLVFMPIAK